jgi:hypothetical protein
VRTNSSLFYLHVVLQQGARFGLPKEHDERGFYIAKGTVEVAGNIYHQGQMLVFNKGVDPIILAKENTTLMLLGGEPLGERFIWWNFVSSRKERIEQAKEDWKQVALFFHQMITKSLFLYQKISLTCRHASETGAAFMRSLMSILLINITMIVFILLMQVSYGRVFPLRKLMKNKYYMPDLRKVRRTRLLVESVSLFLFMLTIFK